MATDKQRKEEEEQAINAKNDNRQTKKGGGGLLTDRSSDNRHTIKKAIKNRGASATSMSPAVTSKQFNTFKFTTRDFHL